MIKPYFYKKSDLIDQILTFEKIKPLKKKDIKNLLKPRIKKEIKNICLNETATLHYIYEITFSEEETLILKIPRYEELKYSLYKEYYIYVNLLKKAVIFNISNIPFILMKKAEGICLRNIDMDSKNFPELIKATGREMGKYHNIKLKSSGFGSIDEETLFNEGKINGLSDSWSDYILLNLDAHLDFLLINKGISKKEYKIIKKLFQENSRFITCIKKDISLIHGDIASHNIFVRNNKVTEIIDWEDALPGDPLFDMAMFISFYRMDEFSSPLLEGYKEIRDIDINEIFYKKLWLYYLRIVIAKGVLRFKLKYDEPGKSLAGPKVRFALDKLNDM